MGEVEGPNLYGLAQRIFQEAGGSRDPYQMLEFAVIDQVQELELNELQTDALFRYVLRLVSEKKAGLEKSQSTGATEDEREEAESLIWTLSWCENIPERTVIPHLKTRIRELYKGQRILKSDVVAQCSLAMLEYESYPYLHEAYRQIHDRVEAEVNIAKKAHRDKTEIGFEEEPVQGRHPDITIKRAMMLLDDLIPWLATANATEKGRFLAFWTGFDAEKIRQEYSSLSSWRGSRSLTANRDKEIVEQWKKNIT